MRKIGKRIALTAFIVLLSVITTLGVMSYMGRGSGQLQGTAETDAIFKQPFRLASYGASPAENTDFTYAAEQAIHAVVHIKSIAKAQSRGEYFDPFDFFFGYRGGRQIQPQPRVGFGSGVIISTDGYIVTNNHVIAGADELEVTLNDNQKFSAKIIGTDPNTDIALLKIEGTDFRTLPFGDSEKLKVGEWVLAVGNPFNLKSTVTAGIVSAKGRAIMSGQTERNKIESFIQTDAAVNPGNSGGALVNTKGELIGINTMIYSETGNFTGYSFAVPISIAGKIVGDLKQYGTVQRAVLGVTIMDVPLAKQRDDKIKVLEGAYISEFSTHSSAKEAGLEAGDVVTAVNGVKVKSANALQEQINKYRPGDKVKVEVDRYGKSRTFTIQLRNAQGSTKLVERSGDAADLLGAAFRELSSTQKREFGISYGIEVNGISKGKVQDAGIRKGFIILVVNDERINTPDDLYRIVDRIIKGSTEEQGLFIKGFYPGGRTQHYAIDLVE